ncbi:MAG: hypothetical protein ACRD3J_10740 [Thermoanaerobaculia bacterium]
MSKPDISRYAFAMFDVLGFSAWVKCAGLQRVLDAYHLLIQDAVVLPQKRGSLSAVQTAEGMLLTVGLAPSFAYFSDTILLWCPLTPTAVSDFVERCSDLICKALQLGIPLRGALTLGDAVLDGEIGFFIGEPLIEAANLERGQNWVGLTLGNSAVWTAFLAQLHPTTVIEYPPPMKPNLAEYASPIVLDWPRRWRDKYDECPSTRLRSLNVDPRFSVYWENTITFAEHSLKKHDWHLRPSEIPDDAILRLISRAEAFSGPGL